MTRSLLSLIGLLLCAQLTSCQNLNSLHDLKPAEFSVQLRPRLTPTSEPKVEAMISPGTVSPSAIPSAMSTVTPSETAGLSATPLVTVSSNPSSALSPTVAPDLGLSLRGRVGSSSQPELQAKVTQSALNSPVSTVAPTTVSRSETSSEPTSDLTSDSTTQPAATATPEPTPVPTLLPTPQANETPTVAPIPVSAPVPTLIPTLTPTPTPAATAVTIVVSDSSTLDEILRLTNLERSAAGLSELTLNPLLNQAAQAHADTMVSTGQFSHVINDLGPSDRVTGAGYRWRAVGENIALGYSSPVDVMTGWMNSSGHRANILSTSYTELGVGSAQNSRGRTYWVQVFGRPR